MTEHNLERRFYFFDINMKSEIEKVNAQKNESISKTNASEECQMRESEMNCQNYICGFIRSLSDIIFKELKPP